ncbi:DNA repair protein RadC [Candidatus Binatia bacterium]|nr:DNA repair protein RadC [Candidatus Binatia bacterium]
MPTSPEGPQLELPFEAPKQSVLVRDAENAGYIGNTARPSTTVIPLRRVPTAIEDWPRADRPRDKLLDRGPGALTNTELLAIILRAGTRGRTALDQARALFAHCNDDWRRLGMLGAGDLRRCGLGPVQAAEILAVIEIAKRYGEHEFKPGQPLRGSADVYAHYRERLAAETREHFLCILLDNKHRKIKEITVSQGSLTASIVHPRDVFAAIVREATPAAAVIFVHNHPSGCPIPSKEDIEITRRLREAGEIMGVRVPDHIIIGRGRYVSFVDEGYW